MHTLDRPSLLVPRQIQLWLSGPQTTRTPTPHWVLGRNNDLKPGRHFAQHSKGSIKTHINIWVFLLSPLSSLPRKPSVETPQPEKAKGTEKENWSWHLGAKGHAGAAWGAEGSQHKLLWRMSPRRTRLEEGTACSGANSGNKLRACGRHGTTLGVSFLTDPPEEHSKYSPPSVSSREGFQNPAPPHQDPRMLKSPVENGAVVAYN